MSLESKKGTPAKEEWVEFVNPAHKIYRAQRTAFIEKVVSETKPEGVSIDFIRYFAFWEKIYEGRTLESIPDSSFDTISLAAFQADKGLEIPQKLVSVQEKSVWILENHPDSWAEWKCDNIVSMVRNIVASVKAIQPGIRTNLHAVPWRENDFGGAQLITFLSGGNGSFCLLEMTQGRDDAHDLPNRISKSKQCHQTGSKNQDSCPNRYQPPHRPKPALGYFLV